MSSRKPKPPAGGDLPSWGRSTPQPHELWTKLINTRPRAAALLQLLLTRARGRNVVVVSQKTLGKLMECSVDTVQRASAALVQEGWAQTIRLNGPGTVLAYVINSPVTWPEEYAQPDLASFQALVIADAEDQASDIREPAELHRIPLLYTGDQAPSGGGSAAPTPRPTPANLVAGIEIRKTGPVEFVFTGTPPKSDKP